MRKQLTQDEIFEIIENNSKVLGTVVNIDLFKFFLKKYRLSSAYTAAVNEKYSVDNCKHDLSIDSRCAHTSDLVSCFIDWEKSTDFGWKEVNIMWQEFWTSKT